MHDVSATQTLFDYLCHFEQRYGRSPKTLRISERTVINLAREMPPMLRAGCEEKSVVLSFLKAARAGRAEFCGIRVELTHA